MAMDKCYAFNKTENAEIKYRYIRVCTKLHVPHLLSQYSKLEHLLHSIDVYLVLYRVCCVCAGGCDCV